MLFRSRDARGDRAADVAASVVLRLSVRLYAARGAAAPAGARSGAGADHRWRGAAARRLGDIGPAAGGVDGDPVRLSRLSRDARAVRRRAEPSALSGALLHRLAAARAARSEEHTSELQSLMRISYAVFCLK